MTKMRMRTIKAAVLYLKSEDPETAISENFIRAEIRSCRLPGVIMAGSKYLINMDILEEYLKSGTQISKADKENTCIASYGQLRKIRG